MPTSKPPWSRPRHASLRLLRANHAYAERTFDRYRATLEEAEALGKGTLPGVVATHRLGVRALWARWPDAEARLQNAVAAWQAAGHPARAEHLEGLANHVRGDPEGAHRALQDVVQQDLSSWPEFEMSVHTHLGALAERLGDHAGARRAFEAAVRVGGGQGREASALLGLAELRLRDGHLAAVEVARRLRPRFGRTFPEHILTIELLSLVLEPPDIDAVRAAMAGSDVLPGHLETLDMVLDLRASMGRATDGLDALGQDLRNARG